jgi:hypothetical protein
MRKKIALVVGVALPVIAVAAVAASIYVPRLFVHPKYNFVYSENSVGVPNGVCPRVFPDSTAAPTTIGQMLSCSGPDVKVYLYNVATNTSTQLTPGEQAAYALDTDATSPDGFTVGPAHSSGGPFFGTPYDPNEVYITKGTYSHRLDVQQSIDLSFEFLGWVKN